MCHSMCIYGYLSHLDSKEIKSQEQMAETSKKKKGVQQKDPLESAYCQTELEWLPRTGRVAPQF